MRQARKRLQVVNEHIPQTNRERADVPTCSTLAAMRLVAGAPSSPAPTACWNTSLPHYHDLYRMC
jgi:hypothetical protein